MATTNSLKFYRKSTAPSSPVAGAIWFNTSDKTIQIYTGSAWEKYAGNLKDATWSNDKKTLTIAKHDGSSIALDFSDMASAEGVAAEIARLDKAITDGDAAAKGYVDTQVNAAKAAVIGSDSDTATSSTIVGAKKYADSLASNYDAAGSAETAESNAKSYADNKFQLKGAYETAGAAATALAEAKTYAEGKAADALIAAEGYADTAIANLDNVATSSDNTLVTVKVTQTDGLVKKVNVTTNGIATTNDLEAAIQALDADMSGESTDKHVKVQVTEVDGKLTNVAVTTNDIASAATLSALQGRVEAFLDGNKIEGTVDTLHEIQAWMNGDGVDATELTAAIAAEAKLREDADKVLAESVTNAIATAAGDATSKANTAEVNAKSYVDAKTGADIAVGGTGAHKDAKIDTSIEDLYAKVSAAEAAGVTSLNGQTGTLTISSGRTNGTIAVGTKEVSVTGLGSAAYTDAAVYATSRQGSLADSAVQNVTVSAANGYNTNNEIVTVTKSDDNVISLAFNFATNSELKIGTYSVNSGPFVKAGDVSNMYLALDGNKADKATTLAGYGITDAYTKKEVDALLCWEEF